MTSLRSKILTSFGLSKAALLIFVAVVIADLHFVETHIDDGEVVSILHLASQKIRINEKNLFLYHDPNDLYQLRDQIKTANVALAEGEKVFETIASVEGLKRVKLLLQNYNDLLNDYSNLAESDRKTKQSLLRNTGHELTNLTKTLSQRQREIISDTTHLASRTLIIASVTVILIGLFSAFYIVRRVVRPLTQLEKQLDQLVERDAKELSLPSNDKEIQSFVFHFNSMLKQLHEQQIQLRRNERAAALGVLVSGVAHELNNPLSNISTSVQLLREDSDDTGHTKLHQQWLGHIDGEAERAKRIVRRLLDTVRQSDQQNQFYAASKLVHSAVNLIYRLLSPEINLHIENIPDSQLWIDAERMKQVFINLIMNSVQAGAKNIFITGEIGSWKEICTINKINKSRISDDCDMAINKTDKIFRFSVDDDGQGIPAGNMEKLFDPFFTTKVEGEGTGLGLYLVQQIIRENGGCISAENRPESGARFTIWLPTPDMSEYKGIGS